MYTYREYAAIRRKQFGENTCQIAEGYSRYKTHTRKIQQYDKVWLDSMIIDDCLLECNTSALAHYKSYPTMEVPVPKPWPIKTKVGSQCKKQEEGNSPMAYCNSTTASAKTDAQIQREYLKGRLLDAKYTVREYLTTMYNLYVNQNPKSYKELIDWITNGKYTLDAKRTAQIDVLVADSDFYGNIFDGIQWTGSGRPTDFAGYRIAEKEMDSLYTKTMDIIVTGDASAGLAALNAFEAFVPSNAPIAATTVSA